MPLQYQHFDPPPTILAYLEKAEYTFWHPHDGRIAAQLSRIVGVVVKPDCVLPTRHRDSRRARWLPHGLRSLPDARAPSYEAVRGDARG